jgi:hypothetical protein
MIKLILEYIDKWFLELLEFAAEHPFLTIFMSGMMFMFLLDFMVAIFGK